MPDATILIRDRVSGVLRDRRLDEPVKLRVCRACGRPHTAVTAVAVCLIAA